MKHDLLHLSDERLLLHIDGELPRAEEKQVRSHLKDCWSCRTRRGELEQAIGEFVHVHDARLDSQAPRAEGPRALLRARLAELSKAAPARPSIFSRWVATRPEIAWAAGIVFLLLGVSFMRFEIGHVRALRGDAMVATPDSRLTPGATVLVSRIALCSAPDMKNKSVSATLRKQVFDEYGISGADPSAYEVDYLVTPALGGADDIHNLWPHSYSATAWNAHIKDELEDRLRDLVCDGSIELGAAQQEIATDWIAAYKKYFHTERPLEQYCRRCAPLAEREK